MRNIIPISGKDSLATALLQRAIKPDLEYEFVFNPTGFELPEVLKWIDSVEIYLQSPILKIGNDLSEIIKVKYNFYLPSQNSRYCTSESKINPFVDFIGKAETNVYYGIRADEPNRVGFNNKLTQNIHPFYPLRENGIGLLQVYQIIKNANLKPPSFFWDEIYQRVKAKLNYDPKKELPEPVFDMLFSWRSRANCDRCFNQRLYEWVGLLEHHPNLYWDAESYEHIGSSSIFSWNSNQKTLKSIAEEKERIKTKRVEEIVKIILKSKQLKIFDFSNDESFIDILSFKSCGLMCGK